MDCETQNLITGALSLVTGIFIGHRFAFGRDIHREWRTVRDPVLKSLADEIVDPSGSVVDLSDLRWRINQPWRLLFDRLAASYTDAVNDDSNREYRDWGVHYKDPGKVRSAARWLKLALHWM